MSENILDHGQRKTGSVFLFVFLVVVISIYSGQRLGRWERRSFRS